MTDESWGDTTQHFDYDGEKLNFAGESHLEINRRAYALKFAKYLETAFKLENAGRVRKFLLGRNIKRLDKELEMIRRNGEDLAWRNYDTITREGE